MSAASRGEWPVRAPRLYYEDWLRPFDAAVLDALRPGARVLDVGSGSRPAIAPSLRPPGCEYVGLDISAEELARAPAGSYDRTIARDVTLRAAELEGRFDVVVSWQLLEHVPDLEATFDNLRAYLVPNGVLVAQLSGKFSPFGILNAVIPRRLTPWLLRQLGGRDPATVFPAYYDRCYCSGLLRVLRHWEGVRILLRLRSGNYFAFSRPLFALNLLYEQLVYRLRLRNLATHYLIVARRPPGALVR